MRSRVDEILNRLELVKRLEIQQGIGDSQRGDALYENSLPQSGRLHLGAGYSAHGTGRGSSRWTRADRGWRQGRRYEPIGHALCSSARSARLVFGYLGERHGLGPSKICLHCDQADHVRLGERVMATGILVEGLVGVGPDYAIVRADDF